MKVLLRILHKCWARPDHFKQTSAGFWEYVGKWPKISQITNIKFQLSGYPCPVLFTGSLSYFGIFTLFSQTGWMSLVLTCLVSSCVYRPNDPATLAQLPGISPPFSANSKAGNRKVSAHRLHHTSEHLINGQGRMETRKTNLGTIQSIHSLL